MTAQHPEADRLAALAAYQVLDSAPEESYRDLVTIIAGICQTPISAVSLVDGDRQWFKASVGLDVNQTPRDVAFCSRTIEDPDGLFIVEDATLNPDFSSNPLVTGEPHLRFYAGAPLVSPDGHVLGSLCVMDHRPRTLNEFQKKALEGLARQVVALMELRKAALALQRQHEERDWYEQQLQDSHVRLEYENQQLARQTLTDSLTGLVNRRGFNLAVEQALEAVDGRAVSLAILDLDHFKQVNDTLGHPMGDQVLSCVGRFVQDYITTLCTPAGEGGEAGTGSTDTGTTLLAGGLRVVAPGMPCLPDQIQAARFGGEEFALVFSGIPADEAYAHCEALREGISHLDCKVSLTVSVGMAEGKEGDTIGKIYSRADSALYGAKQNGRNQVVRAELHLQIPEGRSRSIR
jgi:GGDEF domain-containing protein